MLLRNCGPAKLYYRLLERTLPLLEPLVSEPNQFTWMGLALAAMVPVAFVLHPLLGSLLILLSGVADSLDGLAARNQKANTVWGAFLDSTLDRVSDFFYMAGFWVLFWHIGRGAFILASALIFSSVLFSFLISYIKARAQALGAACDNGFMERGLRTLFLIVWALTLGLFSGAAERLLWGGLVLFWGLCLATAMQRLLKVRALLRNR